MAGQSVFFEELSRIVRLTVDRFPLDRRWCSFLGADIDSTGIQWDTEWTNQTVLEVLKIK